MNKERLLKVADHIEKGKLMHEFWSADCISWGEWDAVRKCRMFGGVLGELPIVFPQEFTLSFEGKLLHKNMDKFEEATYLTLADFFDIFPVMVEHLFTPGRQLSIKETLKDDVSRKDMATHIRAWAERKGNERCTRKSFVVQSSSS